MMMNLPCLKGSCPNFLRIGAIVHSWLESAVVQAFSFCFCLLFKVEYRDPEDSYYDEAEFAIVKGNTVFGNLMDDVRFYGELALVRGGIEKIHEALPDYKYVPMRDVREAMYPEKMTTEQLAEAVDEIAEAFDPYEYRDNVEIGENTVQEVMLDLRSGNIHSYISYLKDIVDEEWRAGVLLERLKAYEPELPKDIEPMVYVNYCEKSDLGNPRCQKLSDLDSKTVEQDKAWYADRDPKRGKFKKNREKISWREELIGA